MKITVEHIDGKYPSFNIGLAAKEGADPFLVIKGCRIVDGQKGRFISGPSRKMESGKYFNYTYFGEKFQEAALAAYDEAAPKTRKAAPADDDVPF